MGGVRLIVDALARAAGAAGHVVGAAVDADARAVPGVAAAFDVPLYPFPAAAGELKRLRRFGRRFPVAVVRLVRAVRRFAPDVVSVHAIRRFGPYAAAVRRLTGVPQVLSLQEAALPPGMPENVRLFRMLVHAADVVAACSRESAEYAVRVGGARAVEVVPNGYDPAEFAPAAGFVHPRPYVLGVGRLEAQKGFDVLVRAVARLERRDVDVLLAGEGSQRRALETLAAAEGVADRVRCLGTMDRAATISLLRGATVVACPSRFEGLPLVCVEALAAARPVVGSTVNGIPEIVRHEETGLLVPPDDPAALARALERLLAAPELAARLGARGREVVERDFAWERVTGTYLGVCGRLAERRSPALAAALLG
jgi:phosphatidylinositol alpha-mannosyltransferase/D-inositol-3-phosphate glycosyltransferase